MKEVVELSKEIIPKERKVNKIIKIRYEEQLETYVSLHTNVVSNSSTASDDNRLNIYHYMLDDTTEQINLESFQSLDLKPNVTYKFNDLLISMYKGSRILRWNVMSTYSESNELINIEDKKKSIIQIISVHDDRELKCISCKEMIDINIRDDEGFYECPACGNFSNKVIQINRMTLSIQSDDISSNTLYLNDEIRKNISKKDLILNSWEVEINQDNIIIIEKIVQV